MPGVGSPKSCTRKDIGNCTESLSRCTSLFASPAAEVCVRLLRSTGGGTEGVSGGNGETDRGEIGLSGGDERLGNDCATGRFIAGEGISNATFFISVARPRRGDLRGCVMDRVCGRLASVGLEANHEAAVA